MGNERQDIIKGLTDIYGMELETALNFLANSINLDGVRAEEIKKSLAVDVTEEIVHAQRIAARIKQLGGQVPGSRSLSFSDTALQPPADSTDVVSVIRGVIAAEERVIDAYNALIRQAEGCDYVTQDICVQLLGMEEEHRILFAGFLKEYER